MSHGETSDRILVSYVTNKPMLIYREIRHSGGSCFKTVESKKKTIPVRPFVEYSIFEATVSTLPNLVGIFVNNAALSIHLSELSQTLLDLMQNDLCPRDYS